MCALNRVATLCNGNIYIRCSQLYRYCMLATLLEFGHCHITSSLSTHNTDKSRGKRHAREISNFLMPVCLIVCKCSFCLVLVLVTTTGFSPEFLFQQDKTYSPSLAVLQCNWYCGPIALWPSGSPFGDPGPHGDLFQFLGPHFMSRSPFFHFRLKNAWKVNAASI